MRKKEEKAVMISGILLFLLLQIQHDLEESCIGDKCGGLETAAKKQLVISQR